MIEHEAKASSNMRTFVSFMALLIVIFLSTAVCCFMVYNMSGWVALRCLIMLIVGWIFVDILITRTFYCIIIALILWCKQRHK